MRAYDLTELAYSIVANDECLSLPFIKEGEGGLKIGFFTYEENDFDEKGKLLEKRKLLRVFDSWVVDPDTTVVKKDFCPQIDNLPCIYNPLANCTKENYETIYENYCNAIDKALLNNEKEEYERLASQIVPNELVYIYQACGAKFLL